MSIQVRNDSIDGNAATLFVLQPGQKCFYCYQEITDIAVMWSGEFDLWLHPACCQRLMLRLSRDCWEIECKQGGIEYANRKDELS